MARTTTQGQSYPLLSQVSDPTLRTIFRVLMDQINELRQPASTQDLGGNTITGVATPTESTHVANKDYVDTAIASVRETLSGSGDFPLDVTALRGQLSQVQRAKIRINPAAATLPTVAQPFELIYDVTPAKFKYWNADTSKWIVM